MIDELDAPTEIRDQIARDRAYREEYLRWVASLTPADRAALKELGLDRPKTEATTFSYLRPEVFRESSSQAGMRKDLYDPLHDWQHPAERIDNDDADELPHLIHGIDPDSIRALIGFLVPDPGPRRWRRATLRLAILARWIDDSVREMTLDQLAADLAKSGIALTKQRLSQMQLDLADALGADAPGGKTSHGREQYRQSAIRVWETRGTSKKAKSGVPGEGHDKTREDIL